MVQTTASTTERAASAADVMIEELRGATHLDLDLTADTRTPDLATVTQFDLLNREMQPVRWAIENILPEGVSLLAGKPKIGKSVLVLQIGTAVAKGEEILGQPTVGGSVLYLALEDNERRLQTRCQKQLGTAAGSRHFHFTTKCPKLDEGGIQAIERWLEQHKDRRLVIIDTLALVRSGRRTGALYDDEYQILGPLKELANDYAVAIVGIVHQRKAEAPDFIDALVSTTGLPGAADGVYLFTAGQTKGSAKLVGRGRDIDEIRLKLRQDESNLTWIFDGVGEKAETKLTVEIITFQKLAPYFMGADSLPQKEILAQTQTPRGSFFQWRRQWLEKGWVIDAGAGKLILTDIGKDQEIMSRSV